MEPAESIIFVDKLRETFDKLAVNIIYIVYVFNYQTNRILSRS